MAYLEVVDTRKPNPDALISVVYGPAELSERKATWAVGTVLSGIALIAILHLIFIASILKERMG